jgi:hypothetical protein
MQNYLADDQHWTTTFVDSFENEWVKFATAKNGAVVGNVTVSQVYNLSFVQGHTWTEYQTASGQTNYRKDPIYRETVQPDPISEWTASPTIASQRRRSHNA